MFRWSLLSTSSCINCPPRHIVRYKGFPPLHVLPPTSSLGGMGGMNFWKYPFPPVDGTLGKRLQLHSWWKHRFTDFHCPSKPEKAPWSSYYVLSYLDLAHVPYFLPIGLFAILSASVQALRFEVRSFDNFKDCKSQLTHVPSFSRSAVFSFTSNFMLCAFFYPIIAATNMTKSA